MSAEAAHSVLPFVSVCIPVKNGAKRLPRCLQALRDLDYPADRLEVIVADGRSIDDSVEVARSYGAKVLDNPGEIVATGRNVAFDAAQGDFIACIDDDIYVPRDWIRTALPVFEDSSVAAVGGISRLPEDAPVWAQAVNAVFRMAGHLGYSVQSDYLGNGDAEDIPGGNAFYRTEVYRSVAPFDAGLVTAEDVELHIRMRADGHRMKTSTALFVWHDKRPTPSGVFRQLRRFGEGRVQLARKFPQTLRPLHRLMGWALPISLIAAATAFATLPLTVIAAVAAVPYLAVVAKALIDGENFAAALLTPAALLVMMIGWSIGYLKERFFPMPSTVGR